MLLLAQAGTARWFHDRQRRQEFHCVAIKANGLPAWCSITGAPQVGQRHGESRSRGDQRERDLSAADDSWQPDGSGRERTLADAKVSVAATGLGIHPTFRRSRETTFQCSSLCERSARPRPTVGWGSWPAPLASTFPRDEDPQASHARLNCPFRVRARRPFGTDSPTLPAPRASRAPSPAAHHRARPSERAGRGVVWGAKGLGTFEGSMGIDAGRVNSV